MVELWIMIIFLCLLTTLGGALIAQHILRRTLDHDRQEREAWQQAQEGRQRTWEVRQGKHIIDAEKKLADQLKDARREWRDWNTQIQQNHEEWRASVDLEQVLARLPHIEEVELGRSNTRPPVKGWQPAQLYHADLSGRDLSYRYLERADLRQARLANANLYMADLSGAVLTGADLQQADLTGCNLSGADLRGANLADAKLLVADLHNAILHGTRLTGALNLTPEQLQTAVYDSTTSIDSYIDITLPRIPGVVTTPPELLSTALDEQAENVAPDSAEIAGVAAVSPDIASTPDRPVAVSSTAADTEVEPATNEEAAAMPVAVSQNAEAADEPASTDAEVVAPARETGKKSNTSRKRVGKGRKVTPAAQADELPFTPGDEEEPPTGKIIQLQERATKPRIPAVPGEQKKDEQPAKKTGTQAQSSFFERSS